MARRLAHLGPRGTYTEAAAIAYDADAVLLPQPNVAAAVAAVEAGEADAAVCAIENSVEGGVTETLDQLLRDDFDLSISGEVVLPIRHALVAAAGVDLSTVTVVYSHPQALAQCRERLRELVPNAAPVAALSTASAIEGAIAEPGAVAVGSELAAQLYDATIYAQDIADAAGNETRFIVLTAKDHEPTGSDKTSIAFTTYHDRPGSLVDVLGQLSQRALNMTRIESRPTREQLGTYVFLIDFDGHRAASDVADALEAVAESTLLLRVLGSYPRSAEGDA
ncbi:MAG TPA: prephenate dehydratase [Dehalococcoidia bacterium]|nr:prephenate dehydratase [Dehalococcoidia bacterium]